MTTPPEQLLLKLSVSLSLSLSSSSVQDSVGFSSEVRRLLHQMDEDRDGRVSFEEFTHYMAAVSLIQTTPPSQDSAPSPSHPTLAVLAS